MAKFLGLCHDLGHGPFSHVFESLILPQLNINNYVHEKNSVYMAIKIA